jgi:pimeloyl-ACP methyl ester carboxylesterase
MPAPTSPPHPWLRRVVRIILALVVLLAASAFIYENISESRDTQQNPMPGRLLKASGSTMHIDCMGQASTGQGSMGEGSMGQGSPTVILESGLGDSYISWRKVQPEIAKFARVCSYDRAGLGFSDSSSRPRTSSVIAEELHALLQAAAIAPPYILVGHSMGGYDVRLYASLYRSEVAGMVLVDASHPDQENRFPPELKNMEGSWQREAMFVEYTMPFGLPRLMGLCDPDPRVRAAECNFHSARESLAEMKLFSESAKQAGATGSLGDMPLAVLSHDPDKPSSELPADLAKQTNDAWEKMQEELAHLSTRGTQTVAKNSAHYIQLDRPELVIEAIRSVADQSRNSPPKP